MRKEIAFLRKHLLELPIHQGVRPEQIDYMADTILKQERTFRPIRIPR